MQLNIQLLTPEKRVFEKSADILVVPTPLGEISILPNHQNLVTLLSPGPIELKTCGTSGCQTSELLVTTGGILEVLNPNHVLILSDEAQRVDDIDIKKVEEAKQRAEKIMKDEGFRDDVKYADAFAAIEKELAKLRVARRHRSHAGGTPPQQMTE